MNLLPLFSPASDGLDAATPSTAETLTALLIMLVAAKICAELFSRLKQPTVVGEILAGVIIGPHALGWVAPSEASHLLSEIGVMFLLFSVGLETRPAALLRVGGTAAIVAILGVVLPLAAGWWLMQHLGYSTPQSLFVGAAMVATSVGITARVLGGMGLLDLGTARIILGAAIIDDVLGLLVLAGVTGVAEGGFDPWKLAGTAALSFGFVGAVTFLGAALVTRAAPHLRRLRQDNPFFAVAIVLCFALAVAASAIGVAAIIGAFLAGLALAEAAESQHSVHEQIRGVTDFTVPFFLVGIGLQLDLDAFRDRTTVELALLLTAIAIVTKLVGCGLGVAQQGWRNALQVGVGMVPRGEVGIVVAQIGLGLGVIDNSLFGATLFMACATTLVAPPLIHILFRNQSELAPQT